MRNFLLIAQNIDVVPVLNALAGHPDLWDEHTLRTTYPGTPHSQVSDILVWFNDLDQPPEALIDDKAVAPYRAWSAIPQLRPLVFDLMRRVEGVSLGRVMITRLPPNKEITPHVDGGAPATWFTRYQLMLHCLPGVIFQAGNERVAMKTGECWMFDNTQEHSVQNGSGEDRIVLIADIRTC